MNNKCLILNSYVPYDVGYDDRNSLIEYINVTHEVKLLIDTCNATHIIYGGDLNTDTRGNSTHIKYTIQYRSP